jgi:hypothetical protein
MSTESDAGRELLAAVRADVLDVDWTDRLATMLQTTGILAIGVWLGVRWMATDVTNRLLLADPMRTEFFGIGAAAAHHMTVALVVAGVALLCATALDVRGDGGE